MATFFSTQKSFISSLIRQRKNLLRWNKSYNGIKPYQVEVLEEQISRVSSDNSMARFIMKYASEIRLLPPGPHAETNKKVNQLIADAENILIQLKLFI
ncbi:MAG TPA: hypothetical protein PKN48_16200 [Bacteroidales bacterium]|nr:hypothetical protein [Bacteroidales bacterium]